MKQTKHAFSEIPQFSSFDQRYTAADPDVWNLIPNSPRIEEFRKIIDRRAQAENHRSTVVSVLRRQYEEAKITGREPLIDLLERENSYTICTAHQLNLFTGPLYVIYKIASAIKLSQVINEEYKDINCIPVFVLGTEDHDFDEINHVHIFRHRLEWDGNDALAAGQLSTEGIQNLIVDLKEILGESPNAAELIELVDASFKEQSSYARGVQKLIDSLFKEYTILILDMFERTLKEQIKDLFIQDLTENWAEGQAENQINRMQEIGLKIQAPPRPMNTFYIDDRGRHRIEWENGQYLAQGTNHRWTKDELIDEVNNYPEHFSPNVILRPLFQERLLPNLAYIGGGGELAYWVELPDVFNNADIPFPMLIRRRSFHILDERSIDKMEQLNITLLDLFKPVDDTIKRFLHTHSDVELSIPEEKIAILDQLDIVIKRAEKIDLTLGKSLRAERTRWEKNLDQLESRLIRSQKSRMDSEVKQIRKLIERQFPDGKLQERRDNFMPYYLQYGSEFIKQIVDYSDPLDMAFSVLWESSTTSE